MSTLPDLKKLTPAQKTSLALRVQKLKDFEIPRLAYWNYDACEQHEEVQYWCRSCAILPKKHQKVGAAWLFFKGKGLVADGTGMGKSALCGLTIAMLKESGQLESGGVVIVCRAPAVKQWQRELNRMMPKLTTVTAIGTKRKRLDTILSEWDILVVGRETYNSDNEAYDHLSISVLAIDDVDSLRHRKNKIAANLKRLARHVPHVYVFNATPLQKKLVELHSTVEVIGGREIFGSESRFLNTYTQQKVVRVPVRGGRLMTTKKITAYQNLEQFKALLEPMAIRRTPADLDDVEMPAIVSNVVPLELLPAQRTRYREIQAGVLKIIKSGNIAELKNIEAVTIWMKGAACCTGLAALGDDDGPGTSSKLNWVMDKLVGDLADEKVVLFIHNIAMIKAAQTRLTQAGIRYSTVSGMDNNPKRRAEEVQKFWDDPGCKVMLGTSSLESSLNLQCARHLIAMDLIMNPARMTQLAGRIARQGSRHSTVYVHMLINEDTQESSYLDRLETESALIDHVWGSESELFEQLSPQELMQLIIS